MGTYCCLSLFVFTVDAISLNTSVRLLPNERKCFTRNSFHLLTAPHSLNFSHWLTSIASRRSAEDSNQFTVFLTYIS